MHIDRKLDCVLLFLSLNSSMSIVVDILATMSHGDVQAKQKEIHKEIKFM